MRAWKGIKELPPTDPRSFFVIGGLHGEPFRGGGWGNNTYWGGYCNHGNILFPTWHRMYLFNLEEALRSIPGCHEVTLAYWDETAEDSKTSGIPWALTAESFVLDGATIPNPLRSFVFPRPIVDNINGDSPNYSKPITYETVRYPLSGLVGPDDLQATKEHNARYPDHADNVKILDRNIVGWLSSHVVVNGKDLPTNVAQKFKDCLQAPNYTVFSNTSSAAQWNEELAVGVPHVVPLENPHNSIHLAVGGFDYPGAGDYSPIEGANGDMGENDTAGLDPIFHFHHANIDRVFWLWQKKHAHTDHLDVIAGYPGTNSIDNQGPTPGVVPNSWLTLESPLAPFKKVEHGKERDYTSLDCINIEKQLGYTYSRGSLEEPHEVERAALQQGESARLVRISRINRATIRGSFLVTVTAIIDGKRYFLGTEAVLSRWSVQGCANCQTHLEVKAVFPLHGHQDKSLESATYEVEIRSRDGVITAPPLAASALPGPHALVAVTGKKKLFHVEVR